jgi:multidrug resistance efflux pump
MKRIAIAIVSIGALAAAVMLTVNARSARSGDLVEAPAPSATVTLAASGRVEGLTETVELGAAVDGVVRKVLVKQGAFVRRGDLLAVMACEDLESALAEAIAGRRSLENVRARLLRGAREEERQVAKRNTAVYAVFRDQAGTVFARSRALYADGLIAAAEFDRATFDLRAAESNLAAAKERERLTEAPPLDEDVSRADADLDAAAQRIANARDRLDKCAVRAPIDGTVLRVSAKAGESYSLTLPHPLFRLADSRGRKVRAEVDEREIAEVHAGQPVTVSVDGNATAVFQGTVEQIAEAMGRKTVQSGDPAEKSDRDILEVLIALPPESGNVLPIGLRVTARFGPAF